MIVTIYDGPERGSAEARGDFHFERTPGVGETVAFDDAIVTVTRAWHTPAMQHPGAKFAILVDSAEIKNAAPNRALYETETVA